MTTPPLDQDPEHRPQTSAQPDPEHRQPSPATANQPSFGQQGPPPPYSQAGYPAAPYPYAGYGYAPAQPARPRHLWRAVAAGAVAGAVIAAAVAVPTTIAIDRSSDAAADTPSSGGGIQEQPFGNEGTDPFGGFGQVPSEGGSTTQQSGTRATDAQSQGVVLVDTVLAGGEGAGTGMVLDSDGLVLTNYHVVENSTVVKVTVATTGKTYDATVVGRDKSADVALLKLAGASGLDTVKIDNEGVDVKDPVTAIGNASGQGYLSAVKGTVVAEDQRITASEGNGPYADSEALAGLIETDAAVVPGYSGGPLLDAQGEVVGIDTAASTATSAMGVTRNIGQAYAIPIEDAMQIAEQIENGDESGAVQIGPSAFLGIGVDQQSGLSGASVGEIEAGGPADKAGLVVGDTITQVGGTRVDTYQALVAALGEHEPGDRVALTWTTAAGRSRSATVTLGSSPAN